VGRRTGGDAQRLCSNKSGAGQVGVEADNCCYGVEVVAPARAVSLRDTAAVQLPDGRRRGLARCVVGDLGGARRAGVGVGSAVNVTGCTRTLACASTP
jgi:hypothetical protein